MGLFVASSARFQSLFYWNALHEGKRNYEWIFSTFPSFNPCSIGYALRGETDEPRYKYANFVSILVLLECPYEALVGIDTPECDAPVSILVLLECLMRLDFIVTHEPVFESCFNPCSIGMPL